MDVQPVSELLARVGEPVVAARDRASEPGAFRKVLAESQQFRSVRGGDTLSQIVAETLRASGQEVSRSAIYAGVSRVAQANGLRDPDFIRVGQRLDLSALGTQLAKRDVPVAVATVASLPEPKAPARIAEVLAPPLARSSARIAVSEIPPREAAARPVAAVVPTPRPVAAAVPAPVPSIFSSKNMAGALYQPIAETLAAAPAAPSVETRVAMSVSRPWESIIRGPARLTSEFGPRSDPFSGVTREHHGIDLAARRGSEVFAPAAGRVKFSGWNGTYGNIVIVSHADGTETRYGHNQQTLVSEGDRVTPSTPLAKVGSTGRATAAHLHFEVRRGGEPIDPVPYLIRRAGSNEGLTGP